MRSIVSLGAPSDRYLAARFAVLESPAPMRCTANARVCLEEFLPISRGLAGSATARSWPETGQGGSAVPGLLTDLMPGGQGIDPHALAPLSHGSSSAKSEMHSRQVHGIRVRSVPRKVRRGPKASTSGALLSTPSAGSDCFRPSLSKLRAG